MSYNDGNPFYSDSPQQHSVNQHQQQQHGSGIQQSSPYNMNSNNNNNNINNQPQAIFTNTNVNFDDYDRRGSVSPTTTQYQPDLQFQSFGHQDNGGNNPKLQKDNRIGGSPSNVPEADFAENVNLSNGSGASLDDNTKYSFWQVPYYRFLFNVDTVEVGQRLLRSMMPIKFSFFDLIKENPDLYGPFWVLTSLVFIIAISANLNEYFQSDHSIWKADMNKVTYSAIAIYGYAVIIPIILWAVFKWMKLGIRLMDMLCIYGYALFVYIPISVLCVIPIGIVQWAIVAAGALVSGAFLVTNIYTPLKESATKRGVIICAVIGVLHAGLALTLRLYFFANYTSDLTTSEASASQDTM